MSTRRLFTRHCKAEGMGWRTQEFTWSGKDQKLTDKKKKKSRALHENAPIVSKNHARKVESSSDWL